VLKRDFPGWKQPALSSGEAIRKEQGEGRRGSIGRALRHSGRPPELNPKGRDLLRRGFVEGLARSPVTIFALLLPSSQNLYGAGASTPENQALHCPAIPLPV
jgi:hypothetical protein